MKEPVIYESIIVGAGFGGLCMGIKLKQAGHNNFLILEKADSVGGTWRENTYPGAECDIASALYSYSFAQNPTWDFKWAKQKQILDYLNKCTDDFGLRAHLRFAQDIHQASYDDRQQLWTLETKAGEVYQCRFFIPALGQLHHANIPDVSGLKDFQGTYFHSAHWQHDVDLQDKSVAVIGNAASAVQLIPEIAKSVKQLTIYQRSANWIIPKGDRAYSKLEKFLAKFIPGLSNLYRVQLWSLGEFGLLPMIRGKKLQGAYGRRKCEKAIQRYIKDPALQKALIPDYPIGAKRILLTDKYYPALAQENVELVTAKIDRLTDNGIIDSNGVQREHEVIVFATGFKTNPFLQSISITGKQAKNLNEHWKDGAHAYLGISTAGFPNLFMLYGPNTNTGHTSVVLFHEIQANYIVKLIQKTGQGSIDVDPDIEDAFNTEIQTRLQELAWSKVDASWYKDADRITNNWPGSSLEYKRRLKSPDWSHFIIS